MSAIAVLLPLSGILLLVGALVGATGIGGVLLVPSLTYFGLVPIHVAIASASFSYLFTGVLGAALYARKGSIRWSMCLWLSVGAMPGAYLGAATQSELPGWLLELLIAILVIGSGVHALARARLGVRESLSGWALFAIGLVVGFGSALSGTGGPLILVPILIWLDFPVLTAIGLSQVIMVPVALLATAGNLINETFDLALGLGIGAVMIAGTFVGAWASHRVSGAMLRRVVALLLIAVGSLIVARLAYDAFAPGSA